MRSAVQRLARLAEALNFLSDGDCICSAQPPYAVTVRDPEGNDLPSDPAEVAKLDFTCPVHGHVGPAIHIRVTRFSPIGDEARL